MLASFARIVGFLTMAVGAAGAVLLGAGFCWFYLNIPGAIELLAVERGKRLLISGVHRDTRAREIARLTPLYSKYFSCCIDLDRSALNTFGNALETKHWAREHNFNSLIVGHSNWT